jgi:hypothetical protein
MYNTLYMVSTCACMSDKQRQSFNIFKMQRPKWALQFPTPPLAKYLNFGDCSSPYENSVSLLMERASTAVYFMF